MQIRRIEEKDLEKVYEWGMGAEEFSVTPYSRFWPLETLKRWVTKPDDALLVAEEDGEILGFVLSIYHKETGKGIIENIYVAEGHRGRGVGGKLLKACVDQLKANGARHVDAGVKLNNEEARKFFKKCGDRGYKFEWYQIR